MTPLINTAVTQPRPRDPHASHVNYAYSSVDEVVYPRLQPGKMFQVSQPNTRSPCEPIPSEMILLTRGAIQLPPGDTPTLSHCAHYYVNKVCSRGDRCGFVHYVRIDPNGPGPKPTEHTQTISTPAQMTPPSPVQQRMPPAYLQQQQPILQPMVQQQAHQGQFQPVVLMGGQPMMVGPQGQQPQLIYLMPAQPGQPQQFAQIAPQSFVGAPMLIQQQDGQGLQIVPSDQYQMQQQNFNPPNVKQPFN